MGRSTGKSADVGASGRFEALERPGAGLRSELNANELAVLTALRAEGTAPANYLRSSTLRPQAVRRILESLEARGVVVRAYNPWGPQTPWWWVPAKSVPAELAGLAEPVIARGQIWDWGEPSDRLWVEVKEGRNEFGLPRVIVSAGEHNGFNTVLPAHYFVWPLHLRLRGPVTDWSSHFFCPNHGECTDEMVRTDKTCALCGSGLNRV